MFNKKKYDEQWRKNHPKQICLTQKRYYKKQSNIMHELKINGCAICGYNTCDRALSFHHVIPEDKKFEVTTTRLRCSNERIVSEIQKCILLCANCHMEIHDKEVKNA